MQRSIFFIFIALLLVGCGESKKNDIPRRKAYPRIEIPDSIFTPIAPLPFSMEANAAASAEVRKSDGDVTWIDIDYPKLDAHIYITYTPVTEANIDEVVDNRVERIALNLGGKDAEVVSLSTGEFDAEIYISQGASNTPVQFLAVNPEAVVSGATFLPAGDAANDSLRPVVNMLERDVLHMIKTLRR